MHMCVTLTSVKHAFSLTRFKLWRKISAWHFVVLVKDVLIGKADFCERNPIIDQVIPHKGHVEGVPGMICQFCLCGLVCCSCYMVSDAASNALAGCKHSHGCPAMFRLVWMPQSHPWHGFYAVSLGQWLGSFRWILLSDGWQVTVNVAHSTVHWLAYKSRNQYLSYSF